VSATGPNQQQLSHWLEAGAVAGVAMRQGWAGSSGPGVTPGWSATPSVRSCPWGGSRRMHTDSESVQHARTTGPGRLQVAGKPLVIEARVPLVMERRKRVGQ
jgi:hypothetical protein